MTSDTPSITDVQIEGNGRDRGLDNEDEHDKNKTGDRGQEGRSEHSVLFRPENLSSGR